MMTPAAIGTSSLFVKVSSLPVLVFSIVLLLHSSPGTLAQDSACNLCWNNVDSNATTGICQTLTADADALTDGNSDECRGIQYRGVTAKCCDEPATFCHLCEDKSRLPDPDLVVSRLSCAQLGGLASFMPGNATCEDYQGTYGVYCGCTNPIAQATSCRICGASGPPLEYRTVVNATQFQTTANAPARRFCGFVEFAAQFTTIATLGTCGAYQAEFSVGCCNGTLAPGGPTRAPVMSPPTNMTGPTMPTAPGSNATSPAPAGSTPSAPATSPVVQPSATTTATVKPVAIPIGGPVQGPAQGPVQGPMNATGSSAAMGRGLQMTMMALVFMMMTMLVN